MERIIRTFRAINTEHGFTLVELLLSLVIAGVIFGVAAETMIRQADTYSFIANRKTTIADIRHAINQVNDELLHIETSDISDISATNIDFVDKTGNNTSFRLATNGSNLAIYRGNDVLLPNVSDFTIEYQNDQGNVLNAVPGQIPNIRRIKLTITTEATANEGTMSLTALITPRSFIGYTNFQ